MSQRTLCMIFESITTHSAIAKIALSSVRAALAVGWQVTVVAIEVDESLLGQVEWLKMYGPPRGFALKWLTARTFIKRALGNRRFDVVHGHQPQIADLCDVFQCHFLTRVAYERNCLENRISPRHLLARLQQQLVMCAEDRCYRKWNHQTRMLFCSELTGDEFHRLYGVLPQEEVFPYEYPPIRFPSDERRRQCREALIGDQCPAIVLGYIGGLDDRKGYRGLLDALKREAADDLFLLFAGPDTETLPPPLPAHRFKALGGVSDLDAFYAACDVLIVPSLFDPSPLVIFEATSRGVPVIATAGVGNLPMLLDYEAGLKWEPGRALAPIVRQAVERLSSLRDGAKRMADELGASAYVRRLSRMYEDIACRKLGRSAPSAR